MTAIPAIFPQPTSSRAAAKPAKEPAVPPLVNGDSLSQAEFHRRYRAMPSHIRAELIGGTVYMASPVRVPHGDFSQLLSTVVGLYRSATPGVHGLDNATVILGVKSEPQPDIALRLLPECGGSSAINNEQYLVGPPELVLEVAHSSKALDLHRKKADYAVAKILEYLVLSVQDQKLYGFDLSHDRLLSPSKGVYRSSVFPGLWIDVAGVLAGDAAKVIRTAGKGLASTEHADFVKKMKAMLRASKKRKK